MSKIEKYKGITPAFYACYDDHGMVCPQRTQAFTEYLIGKGIQGLYVGGSSGECIYQTLEERKTTLENVMKVAKGRIFVIAHVGAPATQHSVELAKHAAGCGVDALSSIPPIYFGLSEEAIREYWTQIVQATDLDFIIYNIPQTTPYSLSMDMLKKMCELPQVIGVKNSSMPVLDIQKQRMFSKEGFVIFNGPDEQYIAGRMMGANGGIGGTYAAMPELFLEAERCLRANELEKAAKVQIVINECIIALTTCRAHMYCVIKETLKQRGMNIGTGRPPLFPVLPEEIGKITQIRKMIEARIKECCA
ncbi:MAG: dihydrodipicolinate synthase family protein [Spirochaetia bacterium]